MYVQISRVTHSSTDPRTYVHPHTRSVTVLHTLLQTFSHPQSQPKMPQKKSQMPQTTLQTAPHTVLTTLLHKYCRACVRTLTNCVMSWQTWTKMNSTIDTTIWISRMTGWKTN